MVTEEEEEEEGDLRPFQKGEKKIEIEKKKSRFTKTLQKQQGFCSKQTREMKMRERER